MAPALGRSRNPPAWTAQQNSPCDIQCLLQPSAPRTSASAACRKRWRLHHQASPVHVAHTTPRHISCEPVKTRARPWRCGMIPAWQPQFSLEFFASPLVDRPHQLKLDGARPADCDEQMRFCSDRVRGRSLTAEAAPTRPAAAALRFFPRVMSEAPLAAAARGTIPTATLEQLLQGPPDELFERFGRGDGNPCAPGQGGGRQWQHIPSLPKTAAAFRGHPLAERPGQRSEPDDEPGSGHHKSEVGKRSQTEEVSKMATGAETCQGRLAHIAVHIHSRQ